MATTLEPASEDRLVAAAHVLETFGERHGLENLRLAGDGQLIATVAEGRTLLDVARFELDASAALGATVSVISAGAPLAADLDRGPLRGMRSLWCDAVHHRHRDGARRQRGRPDGGVHDVRHSMAD